MTSEVEGSFAGVDGTTLWWRGWLPAERPTGVLLIAHGAGEHCGRYQNVVETLVPDGWAVYGIDLRGHGRSDGVPVHVERFSDWLDDYDAFRREVASRHPNAPLFLLGHSVGGQIALAYAIDHQEIVCGLVLSAPFLSARLTVPKAALPLARYAARRLPQKRIKLVDLNKISQDAAVVRRYKNDRLVHKEHATLTLGRIVESQFEVLIEHSRSLRIPLLVQHGDEDSIAGIEGSRRLVRNAGSRDKTLLTYKDFWHEIYNEPERHLPLGEMRKWLAHQRALSIQDGSNRLTSKDRRVFLVHGRNLKARDAVCTFLRSIDLQPIEWSEAIAMTGKTAPYIGSVLDAAFNAAQAIVVLMTPDETAQLRIEFGAGEDDQDLQPGLQPRPNVLFEAGMALGRDPERTVIVKLGNVRQFSDIAGRHVVQLHDDAASRKELAGLLETAGCAVGTSGTDWLSAGNFADLPGLT